MPLGARLTRGISPNWQPLVVGNRLHAGDGVMTRLGPIGRLGRHTATPLEHLAVAGLELQVIQAKPELPVRQRAGAAHESQRRLSPRLTASAQARGCISPHLRPKPGWWRSCRASDAGGGSHQQHDDRGGLDDDRSDRHDPQRRGHRADVRHAGPDQGRSRSWRSSSSAPPTAGSTAPTTARRSRASTPRAARTPLAARSSRSTRASRRSCSAPTPAPTRPSTCCTRSPPA